MKRAIVTEKALRELVNEVLDGKYLNAETLPDQGVAPVNVNSVVDQSAAETDPINPNFTPQTIPELDVALRKLVKDVPIDSVPALYKAMQDAVDSEEKKSQKGDPMKKTQDDKKVEEAIRQVVRNMLAEAGDLPPVKKIPYGVHGAEYMNRFKKSRDDLAKILKKKEDPELDLDDDQSVEEPSEKKKKAYKSTAIGGMADVSGASFQDIAKELGFSVAGAKQAVDKALLKARFLQGMDEDEREILVLTAMNDYIKMLGKSGELTAADVQLMKDHPDIVRELDGFREFLHNVVKRAQKKGQTLEDPLGEGKKKLKTEASSADDQCPECGGTNTVWDMAKKSGTGYGTEQSLYCDDCEKTFPSQKMNVPPRNDEASACEMDEQEEPQEQEPRSAEKSATKPTTGTKKTKAKSATTGRDIQVDWGSFGEGKKRSKK